MIRCATSRTRRSTPRARVPRAAMASRPEAGVAVRTSALLLALAGVAHADVGDQEIIGAERGWSFEDFQLRTSYIDQNGRGFQSQEGPLPGSEEMRVLQSS